ncbi:MAG TPA: integron integrase, partial [Thermoanaerobaculia bacterium]|nr:integron integrase [Thermoanaerobaculia bacterium]
MAAEEVNAFLTSLAVEQRVSGSTQNQALSALLFLYRAVLDEPLPWLKDIIRAQRPLHLPVVLTVDEVHRVIDRMEGLGRLVAQLLYGSGLRLLEGLMLRVKDVDFERGQITVRDPKWGRDRVTMLPRAATASRHEQLVTTRLLHEEDLAAGFGRVWLPDAIARKLPSAPRDWRWQWVFPAPTRWRNARGEEGRHHLHESNVQRAVSRAANEAGIDKRVTCHTFRHHADCRIMPTAVGCWLGVGGDRAFRDLAFGIIRGVPETRAVDPSGG